MASPVRSGRVSDQGKVYAAFIEGELKAERERRTAYDTRGQALVTTSGALVTLIGGFAALVRAGSGTRPPIAGLYVFGAALVLFVGAAACGIAAGWNRHHAVATIATLKRMLTEHWKDDEVTARNNVSTVYRATVDTLRQANDFKAKWVSIGLILQVCALVASGTAVVIATAHG